jgi:hypothetical protein
MNLPVAIFKVSEVPPRKDHRDVDLISDALPFGRLWWFLLALIGEVFTSRHFTTLQCGEPDGCCKSYAVVTFYLAQRRNFRIPGVSIFRNL